MSWMVAWYWCLMKAQTCVHTSMARRKNTASSLLTHWRHRSLAPSHRCTDRPPTSIPWLVNTPTSFFRLDIACRWVPEDIQCFLLWLNIDWVSILLTIFIQTRLKQFAITPIPVTIASNCTIFFNSISDVLFPQFPSDELTGFGMRAKHILHLIEL